MITKVKWNNHEILGNLELNFTKNDGSPYSTIVLAGENGTVDFADNSDCGKNYLVLNIYPLIDKRISF